MILEYVGPKPLPYRLNTPIPFLARSDREGEIAFNPTAEVKQEWAEFLLTNCGETFRNPDQDTDEEMMSPLPVKMQVSEDHTKWIGRRFKGKAGKWKGYAWLKKSKFGEIYGLKKIHIGNTVIGWEVCPIALADVGTQDAPIPWKLQEGQKEGADEHDSDRINDPVEG